MPSNTPFLMGSGEGVAPPAGAARALPAAGLPSAAPHAAATDVFRKSRRDASLLISPPQDVKSGATSQEAGGQNGRLHAHHPHQSPFLFECPEDCGNSAQHLVSNANRRCPNPRALDDNSLSVVQVFVAGIMHPLSAAAICSAH